MLAKLKRIDWLIILVLLGLMMISYFLIESAIYTNPGYQNSGMGKKTLLFYGIGFVAHLAAAFFPYRWLTKFWYVFYAVGVGLLIAVRYYGVTLNNARSWFSILDGRFLFQPAELMKIILIIAIAGFLAYRNGEPLRLFREVLPVAVISFIPFWLVLSQPDLGNAIIFVVIVIGMLWVGNLRYSVVIVGIVTAAILVSGFLYGYYNYHDEIEAFLAKRDSAHWLQRVDAFLLPDQVSKDVRYHVENAMTAIGSGGLLGDGYKQGNSIHNWTVPLPFSDSIFAVLGEEFGFVGSALLLLLYFLLIYRLIYAAIQSEDLTGALIITGIASMLVFQIFENIGMLMDIMPLTGITLPFISYGGSSVLINMTCLGIVQSVRLYKPKPASSP